MFTIPFRRQAFGKNWLLSSIDLKLNRLLQQVILDPKYWSEYEVACVSFCRVQTVSPNFAFYKALERFD